MIEFTRFFLSCVVLEAHIWPLNVPWLAWQSVFGFYTLSGFLMTRVLHVRYGFGFRNLFLFVLNRVLRLWPSYLVVLAGSVAALLVPGVSGIYGLFHLPRDGFDAIANVTVLGLVGVDFTHMLRMTLIVPNSWSLSIEMFCYILLAVYFAKTPKRLCILGIVGCITLTWSTKNCLNQASYLTEYGPYCFQNRYGVLQAGFIPFALGGLLMFYVERLRGAVERWWPWIAATLATSMVLVWLVPALQFTIAPFIGSIVVGSIIAYSTGRGSPSRLSDFIGRASYHLFIAQWVVAAILLRGTPLERDSVGLCVATMVASLAMSGVLVPLEHWVERLRRYLVPIASVGSQKYSGDAPPVSN